MGDYKNFYQRAIELNCNGFKLVPGGTGLGKTKGIKEIINAYQDLNDDRKFIYVANRVQLLNEFKEDIPERLLVHQKNDYELLREADITSLFRHRTIIKYAKKFQFSKNPISLADVEKAYQTVIANKSISYTGNFEEFIRRQASIVMNFFKRILQHANNEDDKDFNELKSNPDLRSLFPYIAFKTDPSKKVLLVTVQKAYHGFFDGLRNVSLFSLDNLKAKDDGNYIIFFDEFDFLENDLISLISEDIDVPSPFNFVASFYNAMKNNKLPLPDYPANNSIRERIEDIIKSIETLPKKGINFPAINHFISTQDEDIDSQLQKIHKEKQNTKANSGKKHKSEEERLKKQKIKGTSIFQTRYTILHSKLYLDPNKREGSFDLTKSENNLSAFTLFRHVNLAVSKIIHLFKTIENEQPIYYNEILRHCFEHSDVFQKAVRNIKQPPRKKQVRTNYDFLHYNGFNLYEIQDLKQETDKNEIGFNHFAIHTTPEKILHHLAENNFVFGLSATANIPRKLRNFDLAWLEGQLKQHYIDITPEDTADIQSFNKEKRSRRNNQLSIEITQPLDSENNFEHEYKNFIESSARLHNDEFGSDYGNYRKNRVELFFKTLLNIRAQRNEKELQENTHLLFFSSFKQIEAILRKTRTTEDEIPLFTIVPYVNKEYFLNRYDMRIRETDFIIVFYDAAQGRSITQEKQTQEAFYKLFWENKPVVFVTTYPSAGNGINLQYYATKDDYETGQKTDFKNIHLMDSPYFYFAKVERDKSIQEQHSIIKKNIYYYTKLLASKTDMKDPGSTVEGHFKNYLEEIRATYNPFNNIYLQSTDGVLNQLAVFIQAIGRIERVWHQMEDQTIYFREEVYRIFEKFCTKPEYAEIKERITPYLSDNLQRLFQKVMAYSRQQHIEIDDWKEEHLAKINKKNQEKIGGLLRKINQLNEGKLGEHEAKQTREEWNKLRTTGLKHQFDAEVLEKYSCVFETAYYKDGEIRLNKQQQIISHQNVSDTYEKWQINKIYDAIADNEIIRNYFANRGYELAFGTINKLFTPYFYQAILSGAIGEEAIKAILSGLNQITSFELNKQNLQPIPLAKDSEIPDELFEIADLKIANKPYFIDCKNYSEHTLTSFDLPEDDPYSRRKLTEKYFMNTALEKLNRIKAYYDHNESKLIYMNLTSSEIRPKRYYKVNGSKLYEAKDFEEAEIIVIQGVLNKGKVASGSEYNVEFEKFIHHLHKNLNL